MQLKTMAVTLAALLAPAAAFCAPATPESGCAALYVTGHQLWSISADGAARPIVRDDRGINSPRWSPSGRRIAYVRDFRFGGEQISEIVVVDSASGQTVRAIPINEEHGFNDVMQLGWRGEKRVWTEGHTTPSSGIYYEWDLTTGKAENELWGSWFTPAPAGESVAHLAHVAHGAPAEHAASKVMVDNRVVYPSKGDARIHRVSGGLVWSGRELVFVDRVNGDASLVSVDPSRGVVTKELRLERGSSIERIELAPDRRRVVLKSANAQFEADLVTGRVRALAESQRTMRVDVEGRKLVEGPAERQKGTVAIEHFRCP